MFGIRRLWVYSEQVARNLCYIFLSLAGYASLSTLLSQETTLLSTMAVLQMMRYVSFDLIRSALSRTCPQ